VLPQIIMTRKEGVFDGVELFRWDFGALFAIPIIVFGFNCHANVRIGCPSEPK
jgi:amino acid permease